MGKAIIIKGADFSANAVERIPTGDVLETKKSQRYVLFLDYQNICAIRQNTSGASGNPQNYGIIVGDVQNYVGRQVRITSATPIISEAYYACFTNSLGDLTFDEIPNLGMAPSTSQIRHTITPIGNTFNISDVSDITQSVTKTVPSGAKYLIVTGSFNGNLTESNFKIELV